MPISGTRRMMTGGWGTVGIDIKDPSLVLYVPLWRPDMVARGGSIVNGTGTLDVSPQALAVGANTLTASGAGTFLISVPQAGTCASGTATITGSPVTLPAGITTSVTTGVTTGTFTVTTSNIIRTKDSIGHLATVYGALWRPNGREFDGTDDYIALPLAFDAITNATILFWFRNSRSANANGCIVGFFKDGTNRIGVFSNLTTSYGIQLESYITDIADCKANSAFTINQWYHIGCLLGTGGMELYVNGTLQTDTDARTLSLADIAPMTEIQLGKYTVADSGNVLQGDIGEFLLYSRRLTAVEIQQNYRETKWRYSG